MDVSKETIDRILELARPETVKVDGREYSTSGLNAMKVPTPAALQVHTLTALVDYLQSKIDPLYPSNTMVHVADHAQVRLLSALDGPFVQRHEYLSATPTMEPFKFGQFMGVEEFIIGVSARFQETEHREQIVKMVSSLKTGLEISLDDDGISQKATAQSGVSLSREIKLPRLVALRPYRTFPEIELQPESEFVFRIRGDEKTMPSAALFEADGGKWKLEAIKSIREWLAEKIPAGVTILA